MKIYRVEHPKNGQGPYWNRNEHGLNFREHQMLPGPLNENWVTDDIQAIRRNYREYHFGFESIRALVKWFNRKWRKAMHIGGFKILVYEVPPTLVVIGSRQVIFNKEASLLVEQRQLYSK